MNVGTNTVQNLVNNGGRPVLSLQTVQFVCHNMCLTFQFQTGSSTAAMSVYHHWLLHYHNKRTTEPKSIKIED